MFKVLKKADIVLAAALIVIGLGMSYFLSFGQMEGQELVVTVDGKKFGSWSLMEDQEISVERNGHMNKITIKDGVVSMGFSDCHGQDCVRQGAISKTGENIICLPHKLVLEIAGGEAAYDSIAR